MPGLTLALLVAYLATILIIGLRARRRAARDEISYFVADRSFNAFWGFIGLASLTTGGSTTIALAALVYTHGLSGLWLDFAGALGLLALSLFLAGRVRRESAVTLPEIVGRHFGAGARVTAGVLVLAAEIVWFALLAEATQVVLTAAFGWTPLMTILGCTAVFVAYTSLGGQYAVVRTDLVKYGLMVIGIPGIALAAALRHAGAWSALPTTVWSFPASPTLPPEAVVALLVTIGLPHMVGSDIYAKLLSCRDERAARAAAAWAGAAKILFGLSVAVIALSARAALGPAVATSTLPRAVLAFVPAPLASLVLVGLVAAMQSSADAVLLSATAVTARDLLAPAARRPVPLRAAQGLAVVYGALGLCVALVMNRNVIETLKLGYSIFAAGLILPVLLALSPAGRRVAPKAAIFAMSVGGAIAAAGRFWPSLALGRDPVLAGTAACGLVLAAALAWPRATERRPSATAPG